MKKSSTIFLAVFLAIILPLTFLTVKIFLNRDNPSYAKIGWVKPEEELQGNVILVPPIDTDSESKDMPVREDIAAEKTTKTAAPASLPIKNHLVSWGFSKSAERAIDTVIIHSSYDALSQNPYSLEGLIKEYQQYGVAPHYLIDREGNIYRLVEDKNIAYHAGTGRVPDGRTDVNKFSLGIEIMTAQNDSPTEEQYAALKKLVDFLKSSYKIKYVLGHSQIAEGRKDDPWNFNWEKIK